MSETRERILRRSGFKEFRVAKSDVVVRKRKKLYQIQQLFVGVEMSKRPLDDGEAAYQKRQKLSQPVIEGIESARQLTQLLKFQQGATPELRAGNGLTVLEQDGHSLTGNRHQSFQGFSGVDRLCRGQNFDHFATKHTEGISGSAKTRAGRSTSRRKSHPVLEFCCSNQQRWTAISGFCCACASTEDHFYTRGLSRSWNSYRTDIATAKPISLAFKGSFSGETQGTCHFSMLASSDRTCFVRWWRTCQSNLQE